MEPIWKLLSGTFYGWLATNGDFYNSNCIHSGTLHNGVLYDCVGKYVGEVVNGNRIGRNEDKIDHIGPESHCGGRVELEPMFDLIEMEIFGFVDPN